MNTTRAYFLASLVIPLTLGLAAVADDVSFHPAKGEKAQKELRIEAEFRVKEASMTMNGEPLPGEMLDQLTSQEILLSMGMDVTETFVATKDGAPTELLRSYDKITSKMEVGDETKEPDAASGLEGKVVRFLWKAEDSEFAKSFHESSGDEKLLETLIDDMEVRAILPAKKVSTGDTWDVAGEHVVALFFPGGITGGTGGDDAPDMDEMGDALMKQLEEGFKDFKVVCTYKGARDADGAQVGEIAFTYDGKASLDLEPILDQARSMFGDEAPEMDFDASATLNLKGEGSVLWNLAGGTLHSYEMRSELGLDVSIQMHMDQQGQQIDLSLSGSLGGDVTWEMTRK